MPHSTITGIDSRSSAIGQSRFGDGDETLLAAAYAEPNRVLFNVAPVADAQLPSLNVHLPDPTSAPL